MFNILHYFSYKPKSALYLALNVLKPDGCCGGMVYLFVENNCNTPRRDFIALCCGNNLMSYSRIVWQLMMVVIIAHILMFVLLFVYDAWKDSEQVYIPVFSLHMDFLSIKNYPNQIEFLVINLEWALDTDPTINNNKPINTRWKWLYAIHRYLFMDINCCLLLVKII